MFYPLLLQAAEYGKEMGFYTGVLSNCYWATCPEDAEAWLLPLRELEIDELALSSYPYFAENMDRSFLRNAIIAAKKLGIPVGMLEVGAPAELADLWIETREPGKIMFKGRASETLAEKNLARKPGELVACPYEDLENHGRVHIGPDGEAQVCQGINMGNVFRRPLREIVRSYDPLNMPVFGPLIRGGPIELAMSCGLSPAPELCADECHLCFELKKGLRERFPETLAPQQCYGVPED